MLAHKSVLIINRHKIHPLSHESFMVKSSARPLHKGFAALLTKLSTLTVFRTDGIFANFANPDLVGTGCSYQYCR